MRADAKQNSAGAPIATAPPGTDVPETAGVETAPAPPSPDTGGIPSEGVADRVPENTAVGALRKVHRFAGHPVVPLAVFACLAVMSLSHKSPTYDEPIILASGGRFLRTWDNGVNAENPPLLKALYALPTAFVRSGPALSGEEGERIRFSYSMAEEFAWANRALLSLPGRGWRGWVLAGRLVVVLVGILLGAVLYAAAVRCWDRPVALVIVWLYALSPNILAHTRLVTPDIGCTAAVFCTVLGLYRLVTLKRKRDGLLLGIFLGCALLSKFTAVLLLVCLPVQVLLLVWRRCLWRHWRGLVQGLGIAGLVSLFLIGAVYGFRGLGSQLSAGAYRSPLVTGLQSLPVIRSLPLPLPEAYIRGFDIVAYNNRPGLPNLFLGRLYPEGGSWWYYYLVVLGLKVPIPLLLLFLGSAAACSRDRLRVRGDGLFFAIVPGVFFLNFSVIAYRQLGLRYILPLWPFLLLFSGFGISWIRARWHRPVVRWLVAVAFGWYVAGTARTHPDYLSYFNEIAGGPDHGWRLLAASNTDWGQDAPALADWQRANGEPPLGLLWYGSWPPEACGVHTVDWDTVPPPPYLALSVTNYYLYRDVPLVAYLRERGTPIARAGRSIHVHAIDETLIERFLAWRREQAERP